MDEALEKALHSAMFLLDELLESHTKGTNDERMVLYPLIKRTERTLKALKRFINAREADGVQP